MKVGARSQEPEARRQEAGGRGPNSAGIRRSLHSLPPAARGLTPGSWLLAPGFLFCFLSSGLWLLHSEIIDRIAISAGNQVITESQIDEDVRLTQFLNREPLNLDLANRKKAASRLIEQALIRREMDLSRYPMPALSDADASLRTIRAGYASEAEYKRALETYGINEEALRRRLWWQATFLLFIDYRFRPGIQIQDSEIQAYYQHQLEKWKQDGVQPVPSLDEARASIEQTLTEQHVDQELDRWLADTESQVAIRYHDEALR